MDTRPSKPAGRGSNPPAATGAEDGKKRGRPKDGRARGPREKVRKAARDGRQRQQFIDFDRQCGVPILNEDGMQTGALCARSLTCKTHSMGAKRAVPGRSDAYDVLLTAYQQKNQLKAAASGQTGAKGRAPAATRAARAGSGGAAAESDSDNEPPLPDSEEVAHVLRGALWSTPRPLDTAVWVPARARSQRMSLTELLYKATSQPPPAPPPQQAASPMAAVLASTQSLLGCCVVFDKSRAIQGFRPSQIVAYERLLQQRSPISLGAHAHHSRASLAPGSHASHAPKR